jgi:hypothetical protein
VDWVDRTGRYMVLNIGGQARVWDKQDDVLYAGSVPGNAGDGWVGISPDARYVVAAIDDKRSYAINHATRTVNTTGVMFWSLCGGHGDLLSATNGKTYFVTFECYDEAAVYVVDVSLAQTATEAGRAQQRATNRKLMDTEWEDDGHMAAAARGLFQDWVFMSVESTDDAFTGGVSSWRPYKQEIVMANVLTGEVRRLAHHRSRGLGGSYFYQPRVSVSWDGTRVAWASNFGYSSVDYADIYAIQVGSAGTTAIIPGTPTVSFMNPAAGATVTGTATVTMAASGGSGTGYAYKLAVDGVNVYVGTNNTFSWNTTTATNAAHTLTATVTDSAGHSGVASRSVTVSNAAVAPSPIVSFIAPAAGATVSGTVSVTLAATGGSGTGYTYKLAVDGVVVYAGTNKVIGWNTLAATNGVHALTATVTDSNAKSGTATRSVTVSNSVATPATLAVAYSGKLRDRVGQGNTKLTPDGAMDGTLTVTLNATGGRTITGLSLASTAPGNWDTNGASTSWALGVAGTVDGVLLNNSSSMAVNFPVANGGTFVLFASDYGNVEFVAGATLTVRATFSNGTTATATTTVTTTAATSASLSLTYNGKLRDRVGRGNALLLPDGALDGMLTVTLNATGGRTITGLRLDSTAPGTWDTVGATTYWALAVAATADGALLNNVSSLAVNFTVANGGRFVVFASDYFNMEFVPGTTLTLRATFSDGTAATATTRTF